MESISTEKTHMNKRVHFEILRCIAVFFVIFNHTSSYGFYLFTKYNPNNIRYWCYLVISLFARLNVPMFFSISGALLLSRKYEHESVETIYFKRIKKVLLSLFVFSIVYIVQDNLFLQSQKSLIEYFVLFYNSSVKYHLWYLYAYIAFLGSLPIIRPLVWNLDKKIFHYIFILNIIYNFIPIIEYLFTKTTLKLYSQIEINYVLSNIFIFPILGYYLEYILDVDSFGKKKLLSLWCFNILTILIQAYATTVRGMDTNMLRPNICSWYMNSFKLINVACVFITVKKITGHYNNKIVNSLANNVGKLCFGIYLLHPIFLEMDIIKNLLSILYTHSVNRLLCSFIVVILVYTVSALITFLLRKIPIIRNVL